VVGSEVVESDQVAFGEIENVDVVADGGAVFAVVVYESILSASPLFCSFIAQVDSPSPKTSNFSLFPTATCARSGRRL
jgi:hypothetical protein